MVEQDTAPGLLSDEARNEVEVHLRALLESDAFSGSRRSREFLQYIVAEFLAGRGGAIKERNIATDVFGKGPEFDAQSDSLVRVKAAEVRKRLAQAYKSPFKEHVRIGLPVGRYEPFFVFAKETPQLLAAVTPKLVHGGTLRGIYRFGAIAALALAAICALIFISRPSRSNLDRLWQPLTKSGKAVLISLPSPNLVSWNEHLRLLDSAAAGGKSGAADSGEGNYVGVGAAEGAAKFGEQLALRHVSFFLKFGADVSFSDLRQSPAILLGAFTSPWTMDLTRDLPFHFTNGPDFAIVGIHEPKQYWKPARGAAGEPRIGYALVSRLLKADSGNAILMAAGIDPHDTQSAVEFLTREEYFDQFAQQADGWTSKNFQLVIRTSIHGHTPSSPQLVSYKTWY
jgi:hypothetical protein